MLTLGLSTSKIRSIADRIPVSVRLNELISPMVLIGLFVISIQSQVRNDVPKALLGAKPETASIASSCSEKTYLNRLQKLGSTSRSKRRQATKEIARSFRNCRNSIELKRLSNERLGSLCRGNQVIWEWPDFWRFEGLALALSNENYSDSIPTLVECVNTTSFFTSLSRNRFPAQMALLKFGNDALPELRRSAIQPGDPKCSIISLLFEIGGANEKDLLLSRLKLVKDPNAEECIARHRKF